MLDASTTPHSFVVFRLQAVLFTLKLRENSHCLFVRLYNIYLYIYRILIDWTPAFGNAARAYGEALQPGLAGRAPNSVPIRHVSAMT